MGEEIKTGVDAEWVHDARYAMKELLRARTTAGDLAETAAGIADAMAKERQKRGGIRNPNDPREIMLVIQENMPAVLAFLESLEKIGEKKRKRELDE